MIITQAHEGLFGEYKVFIGAECVHNVIEIDTSERKLKVVHHEDERIRVEERFPEVCSVLHDGEFKVLWDENIRFNEYYTKGM